MNKNTAFETFPSVFLRAHEWETDVAVVMTIDGGSQIWPGISHTRIPDKYWQAGQGMAQDAFGIPSRCPKCCPQQPVPTAGTWHLAKQIPAVRVREARDHRFHWATASMRLCETRDKAHRLAYTQTPDSTKRKKGKIEKVVTQLIKFERYCRSPGQPIHSKAHATK